MVAIRRWRRTALPGALLIVAATCAPAFDRTSGMSMRDRLRCTWPAGAGPQSETGVIGAAGGEVRLTPHTRLKVPRGALARDVTFTIRDLGGDTVGVEITPATTFARPAEIRIDVGSSRCAGVKVDREHWSVWRSADGSTYERIPTKRPWLRNQIVGELNSNSYIMIAD